MFPVKGALGGGGLHYSILAEDHLSCTEVSDCVLSALTPLSAKTLMISMKLSTTILTVTMVAISGLEAAVVLNQEKSMSLSLGANAKISCSVISSSTWAISWYQQKAGSAPQFLLVDSTRASGLPDRFTYSESGSQEYLHINGVKAEDEAVYYCACVGCEGATSFGGGTMLNVGRSPSPPSLTLMPPSQTELSQGKATLVCMAQGFYPDTATVSWSEGGSTRTGSEVQTGAAERRSDGKYSLISLLTVTAAQWSSGVSYSCQIRHSALSSPLSRSVSQTECR
ncbi:immunoglobulin lambda-1 light chain-like isoform X2 [Brienomyrus brachyistius]|uniref:immunoglobulin lambda-1 light chain-like isoform X2 n=1 Tax=Brienomyrus brachyistius TaxID=42636 RepID=UPI0020B1B899|nr:immunoglobulin lambda-1 light chain-like isoform X2 [Brienomyrus brachyistius]